MEEKHRVALGPFTVVYFKGKLDTHMVAIGLGQGMAEGVPTLHISWSVRSYGIEFEGALLYK